MVVPTIWYAKNNTAAQAADWFMMKMYYLHLLNLLLQKLTFTLFENNFTTCNAFD